MTSFRIAFVSHSGLNIYFFRLPWLKALRREGYEVEIVVPPGEYAEKLRQEGFVVRHFSLHRKGLNPLTELSSVFQLYRIFRSGSYHLVQTFHTKSNIYGALAGKWAKIPRIVLFMGGLGFAFTSTSLRARIFRRALLFLYALAFRWASSVVFVNHDDPESLRRVLPQGKVAYIPGPGVDTESFSLSLVNWDRVEHWKKELGILSEHFVVTTVARLTLSKGIREFVEAANLLAGKYPHMLFLFVGWIDRGNPEAVSEEFVRRREKPYLKFVGFQREVREFLALSDLFVLPSYREGMPTTLLEAQALQKAVVTADVPGCREAVRDGVDGLLVAPRDGKALAAAVERLYLDSGLREKMRMQGRERVEREFGVGVVVGKVLQLYRKLLQELRPRARLELK